jgi:rhodanese-related sulfurtransferase
MSVIDRDELQTLLATGAATLVEALPATHYDAERIPGALNLPGPLTPERAAALAPDRTRTVVTYCSGPGCVRSKVAAAAFERLGYTDVRVYPGGKSDWHAAGLAIEGARAGAA